MFSRVKKDSIGLKRVNIFTIYSAINTHDLKFDWFPSRKVFRKNFRVEKQPQCINTPCNTRMCVGPHQTSMV